MTHSWCRDVQRDESVRAAEDGRSGPLPTLEQCISRAGQFTPSEAPKGAKCPERDNGLRTERVTLDVTHCGDSDASTWLWHKAMAEFCPTKAWEIESVRVVDETHFDDLAQVAMERDAAIREREESKAFWMGELRSRTAERDAARALVAELEAAPAASGAANSPGETVSAEPVGWAIRWHEGSPLDDHLFDSEKVANIYKTNGVTTTGTVIPLYASPPPARGWLTEEERHLIAGITDDDDYTEEGQNIAKAILARSSPPEVVRPGKSLAFRYGDDAIASRDGQWREALAAAGVTCKEVGK